MLAQAGSSRWRPAPAARADCAAARAIRDRVSAVRPVPTKTISPARAAFLRLRVAREGQRLIEIERGRARLRCQDRGFHLAMVGLEGSGRSGQSVGAHQHHAIARGQGAQIVARRLARDIHESSIAGARGHPGGSVENDHVVAARHRGSAEAHLRERQHQQRHADQLQNQRPGLIDVPAPRRHRGLLRRHPESQRGDHLLAARAVEQIQRHRDRGDRPEYGQHLEQREVQEVHGYWLSAVSFWLWLGGRLSDRP